MTFKNRSLVDNFHNRISEFRKISEDDRDALIHFSERIEVLGKVDSSNHQHIKLLRHLTMMAEHVGGLTNALTDRAAEQIVV